MRGKKARQGLGVAFFVLLSLWLLSLIWGLVGKVRVAVEQAHETEGQYRALEERKQTLQANVDALSTDLGKDAAMRTAFGVARPGEEVIVVVPVEGATTTPPKTWWERVMDWF